MILQAGRLFKDSQVSEFLGILGLFLSFLCRRCYCPTQVSLTTSNPGFNPSIGIISIALYKLARLTAKF